MADSRRLLATAVLCGVLAVGGALQSPFAKNRPAAAQPEFKNPVPALQQVIDRGFADPSRDGSYKIKWGVLQEKVDPSTVPSKAEQKRRREEAAEALVNIDQEERDRRQLVGSVFAVLTLALAAALPLLGVSLPFRFALELFPVFLAAGYLESAKQGMWNIAQGGYFDVAGVGIEKIEDPGLAQALLDKVMKLNKDVALQSAVATAALAAAPELVKLVL